MWWHYDVTRYYKVYDYVPEQFQELPGDFGYSELKLFIQKFRGQAQNFAWMAGMLTFNVGSRCWCKFKSRKYGGILELKK